MKKFKAFVLLDKDINKIMSYEKGNKIIFNKRKEDIFVEYNSKIIECTMTLKYKGIDY